MAGDGAPVDGAEVAGGDHDDESADDHGDGAAELAAAALHAVFDGHTEVDETEDEKDATETGNTVRKKSNNVTEHNVSSLSNFHYQMEINLLTVTIDYGESQNHEAGDCHRSAPDDFMASAREPFKIDTCVYQSNHGEGRTEDPKNRGD